MPIILRLGCSNHSGLHHSLYENRPVDRAAKEIVCGTLGPTPFAIWLRSYRAGGSPARNGEWRRLGLAAIGASDRAWYSFLYQSRSANAHVAGCATSSAIVAVNGTFSRVAWPRRTPGLRPHGARRRSVPDPRGGRCTRAAISCRRRWRTACSTRRGPIGSCPER